MWAGTCSWGLRIGFPRIRGMLEMIFQSVSKVISMGVFFESCQQRAVFHVEQNDFLLLVRVLRLRITQQYQSVRDSRQAGNTDHSQLLTNVQAIQGGHGAEKEGGRGGNSGPSGISQESSKEGDSCAWWEVQCCGEGRQKSDSSWVSGSAKHWSEVQRFLTRQEMVSRSWQTDDSLERRFFFFFCTLRRRTRIHGSR